MKAANATGDAAPYNHSDGHPPYNRSGSAPPVEVQYLFFTEEDGCLALFEILPALECDLSSSPKNMITLFAEAGTEYVRWLSIEFYNRG